MEASTHGVRRRAGRSAVVLFGLAAALVLAVGSGPASADPDDGGPPSGPVAVTVSSTAGQTVTKSFDGTARPQGNVTSNCDGDPTSDIHRFEFTVPDYDAAGIDADFTFAIKWRPVLTTATSDLILTVIGPETAPGVGPEVGSSDGGSPAEQVTATNLEGGIYSVLVCGFANAQPQPYTGTVEVRTRAKATDPILPSAPANGLEFSAAVPADQQRDEAEPLIEIDRAGKIYTCGPTGFSNGVDYAQVSTDDGDQFHLLGTPPRGEKGGGGGDCSMATGLRPNSAGNFQFAETGLGPLTGFNTNTSPNSGRTLLTPGPQGNGLPGTVPTSGDPVNPGFLVDRQWQVFIDPAKNAEACAPRETSPPAPGAEGCVLLNYNELVPRNTIVQTSTNGGLTYDPVAVVAAENPRFPGQMRYIEDKFGVATAARNTVY
ncbi:MAG: hypothetical protein M3M94_05450, partial [Actinomycetota bacterium]|nr:hypothetical protein [Actinomycetota bacterium]